MGGQDGYSRTLLHHETDSNTAMGGIRLHPSDNFELGLSAAWTTAPQGLDPYELTADEYEAITPPLDFEFGNSHAYSQIDVTRLDAKVDANIRFDNKSWLYLYTMYWDFSDDDAFFQDLSGELIRYGAAFGWTF